MRSYDKAKYEIDFPVEGDFNWVQVHITDKSDIHYGGKPAGVLLHDGNFIVNGCYYESDQFDILNLDPFGLKAFWADVELKNGKSARLR
jgi:hypothetical protein